MTLIAVQTDSTIFRFGTQSLKMTTGSTGSNAFYAEDTAVEPNLSYTFSAYVRTDVALTGGGIMLRIAQGSTLSPSLADSAIITDVSTYEQTVDGWYRIILTFTVPDGVFTVRPIIRYTGTTAGQFVWVDGVKFEQGDLASAWQLNTVSKKLVIDQGAVQVDANAGGILRLRASTGGTRDTIALATHGLQLAGDTELYSDAIGRLIVEAAATGAALVLGSGATHDLFLRRSGTKIATLDSDGAGTTLTAVDFLGALLRGFSGTSFPASPSTNDRFYRTDLGEWFRYDGTRWRCTTNHEFNISQATAVVPFAATQSAFAPSPGLQGGSDIWLVQEETKFFVNGGATALDASNKWVGVLSKSATGGSADTTLITVTINSGSSAAWRHEGPQAIGALMNNGTVYDKIGTTWTKTGTPGTLYPLQLVTFNHVAT